jgi:Adenylate cyclase, family 3 (some proteins contain HAMP domain)
MPLREFHFQWAFEFKASPEQLWPFVADTNRFNRDTKVPRLEIDNGGKPLPNARRRVRLSIYGMPIEWEEQPFEWVKPSRFGVERIYSKGPMSRMRALAELTETESGGTKLTYDVWATPRNVLGLVAIPLQIRLLTAPRFRATFKRYGELATAPSQPAIPNSTGVSDLDHQRLSVLKEKLVANLQREQCDRSLEIANRLVEFVRSADDFAVARIRAYQLADEWREDRRTVLGVCLLATRAGILDLQWDILCPHCRGAQVSESSLKDVSSGVHCRTCRIDFTATFDRYVELTFRPNAAVRRVDVTEYCIGSPERTPHVVAQQLLRAGEVRKLNLPLEPGGYRLRSLELSGALPLKVSSDGAQSARLSVSDAGFDDEPVQIKEKSELELVNETSAEQLFILERTAWTDQATTAAEVTALQMFRDLFSSEALRPGEQISVGTLTVLFTDLKNSTRLYREIGDATAFGRVMNHFDVLRKAIAEQDGAIVKTIGDAVMAVFRRPVAAVLAVRQAQKELANPADAKPLTLKAGIHTGPCIAVTLNDRLDYFGSTVNLAARLEGLSTGSDVIISGPMFDDPEVARLLKDGTVEAEAFDMSVKGFDEECFQLWRLRSGQ